MENEAAAIIANSSPAQVATGELMVLKNTIKKFCKGGEGRKLVTLANLELGGICAHANNQNLNMIQNKIIELREFAKSNNQARLKYELELVRSFGI